MFDTDLTREYELATSFGISPLTFYEAGLKGALCDAETKNQLEATGQACSWPNGIAGSNLVALTGGNRTRAPATPGSAARNRHR